MKHMGQLEVKLLPVRDANIAIFFGHIVQCSDSIFGLLSQTRLISICQIMGLQGAIDTLASLWPTQRIWEKRAGSISESETA
jgi:hypothetical protein